jgi:thiamine kinase-like enzyme
VTRPGAANVRMAIPHDERLPQIAVLLDADAMARTLARSLGRDDALAPVDVRYIRYRPGKNLCVHYVVDVDGAEQHAVAMASTKHDLSLDAADPVYDARIALVAGRAPAARPLLYDTEARALLQWLPFDIDMPALAEPPSSLRERLSACGVEIPADRAELTLLQYRPRRRVALRFGDHVLKVYRYERDFSDGVGGLEAASRLGGLRTAQREAVVADLRLTAQEWLPGAPPARRADLAREAGEVLRELHGQELHGLEPLLPSHRLDAAATAVGLVSIIAPALAERAQAALRELERQAPDIAGAALVTSHGDFHGGQLLELPGGPALIDLDLLGSAPPALDLANYAGHLIPRDAPDLAAALTVLESLVEGYGRRPPWLEWYLAASILRRSRVPFRNFERDWPEQTERLVAAAEAALRL